MTITKICDKKINITYMSYLYIFVTFLAKNLRCQALPPHPHISSSILSRTSSNLYWSLGHFSAEAIIDKVLDKFVGPV